MGKYLHSLSLPLHLARPNFPEQSIHRILYFNPQNEPNLCDKVVGYIAVYRICFAMAVFFVFFCLIMYGVKSSKDARSGIQNGFWGIKVLIFIGTIVGAFFIPDGKFTEGNGFTM